MKDLLLGVLVVVKTLNLIMSRCHLAAGYVRELRAARAVRLLFFIQPITSFFELPNGFMHPAGVGRALMVVRTPHVGIKLWYIYPKAPNL